MKHKVIVFFILGLFVNAWWRVQAIRLGYRVEQMKHELNRKKDTISDMELTLSKLSSAGNLAAIAKERYNLVNQDPKNVIIVTQ